MKKRQFQLFLLQLQGLLRVQDDISRLSGPENDDSQLRQEKHEHLHRKV